MFECKCGGRRIAANQDHRPKEGKFRLESADKREIDLIRIIIDLDKIITDQNKRLAEKDKSNRELIDRTERLECQIFEMEHSLAWQLKTKYDNAMIIRYLPHGSKQREIYDLGINGGKILVNHGWMSFFRNVKGYLKAKLIAKKHYSNDIEIPVQNEELCPEEEFRFISKYSLTTAFSPIVTVIDLKKGANIIKLNVTEGCEQPCSIAELSTKDARFLSLAIKEIKIKCNLIEMQFALGNNWHGNENTSGDNMRWMANDATIFIFAECNCQAELSMQASSFYRPRTLGIFLKYIGKGPIVKIDNAKKYIPLKKVMPKADMDMIRKQIDEIAQRLRKDVCHD
jgi:hypothetical protein